MELAIVWQSDSVVPVDTLLAVPDARVRAAPAAVTRPAVTVPPDDHVPHHGELVPQYGRAPAAITGCKSAVVKTVKVSTVVTAPTRQAARAVTVQVN
jgi:hypothetical protein